VTVAHKAAFCIGIIGWVLGDRLIAAWSLFYFLPPDESSLPQRLPEWTLFGVVTVWGLISIGGRVVDGVVDPVVANWSDRTRHAFGRRRIFLVAGVVPLAICTGLIFFPPDTTPSWANATFAAVVMALYFIAFTVYANPLQALMVDLGRTPKERLDLSTVQAVAMLVGAALIMVGVPAVIELLGGGLEAWHQMALIFGGLSFVLMLAPILGIPENKLANPTTGEPLGLIDSLKQTLRARGMKRALVGNISFWFGFNAISSGVPYIVTVLMKKDETYTGFVLTITFAVTAATFPLWNMLAKKIGNERTVVVAAVILAGVMLAVPLIDDVPSGLIILGIGGAPVAAIMALPNAIISDLADLDARSTGNRREAMFFGAQAFFLKVNIGVSTAVLAALLTLGKSVDKPLGVQLIGPVTAGVLILTVLAYWRPLIDEADTSTKP
jgi:GPH family glycoside/pentoside/hexuronide:cation symporter